MIDRLQKFYLAAPIWHPFLIALIIGAVAGFIHDATSFERWQIWPFAFALALSVFTVDAWRYYLRRPPEPFNDFRPIRKR